MKNLLRSTLLWTIVITMFGAALAQETRKSPADAETMVKKAVAYFKANGMEKAFAAINNPKGQFVDGDLYIFVYDLEGKCLAHGADAKRVGKDLIDSKDADGKFFVKERIYIAKQRTKGWQNYKWANPVSKKVEEKTAYIELADGMIFGCGAYK